MRKYFVQLLAEFQRLGATVVYADFGRIVLGTKKRRIPDALSYVSFVCASLHQKELFRSLELNVQHCWQLLVWLDPANYGGVKGKSDAEKGNEGWFLFSFYFVVKGDYNFRVICIFSLFRK
jgi:DNA polymerase epsilon subunit 1